MAGLGDVPAGLGGGGVAGAAASSRGDGPSPGQSAARGEGRSDTAEICVMDYVAKENFLTLEEKGYSERDG